MPGLRDRMNEAEHLVLPGVAARCGNLRRNQKPLGMNPNRNVFGRNPIQSFAGSLR